jgi:hypothetical protein
VGWAGDDAERSDGEERRVWGGPATMQSVAVVRRAWSGAVPLPRMWNGTYSRNTTRCYTAVLWRRH